MPGGEDWKPRMFVYQSKAVNIPAAPLQLKENFCSKTNWVKKYKNWHDFSIFVIFLIPYMNVKYNRLFLASIICSKDQIDGPKRIWNDFFGHVCYKSTTYLALIIPYCQAGSF